MRFFFPDSQDQICPGFDFLSETWPEDRVRQRDDLYAHEALGQPAYSGILVSKPIVDGDGSGRSGRYTLAQRHRLYRLGVRRFFRLDKLPEPRIETLGDCGAFSYVNESEPPYNIDDVLDFYDGCRFDAGISIDHLITGFVSDDQHTLPSVEDIDPDWQRRQQLTLDLAADFLRRHRARKCSFEPVGVAQGWSPASYAYAAKELERLGFQRIAVGGLVPIARYPERILACLQAIRDVKSPSTRLHALGVGRAEYLADYADCGVESFDTTSPFVQAFKDDRHNYYASDATYVAVRVPQVEAHRKLKQMIQAGEVDQSKASELEKLSLKMLRDFDSGRVSKEEVLETLGSYQEVCDGKRSLVSEYDRLLTDTPWKNCPCRVCRDYGVEVAVFRGTERNKRRGFHNLYIFNERLQTRLAA